MAVAFVQYDQPQIALPRRGRHLVLVDTPVSSASEAGARPGRTAAWLVYAPLCALLVLAVAFVLSTDSVSPASVGAGGDVPAAAVSAVTPPLPVASFGADYTAQAGDTYWSIAVGLVSGDEAPAYVHRLIAVNGPEALKAGRADFKLDKNGNIASGIGKVSFDVSQLADNARSLIEAVSRAKPASARGRYVETITLASTMSPAVRIDVSKYIKL